MLDNNSSKLGNWFRRSFCCGCCSCDEDGYYLQTGDEPHYSKLSEESFLRRFPRQFFKRKYGKNLGEQAHNNLKQSLLENHQDPWIERYHQANEEYEMDSVHSEGDRQLQEKLIDDKDL